MTLVNRTAVTPLSADLTALVVTFNEAPNLRRTLERLAWVPRVIVLDSFSTDDTAAIARSFSNVDFLQRPFDSFAGQCNLGLEQITSAWVLSLDADYVLTEPLCDELRQLPADTDKAAYFTRFRYCIGGHPLRGSLYPPRAVLFRRAGVHYVQDGHAHRLVFDGPSEFLRGHILHDDRKPLARWLASQQAYARQEADKLLAQSEQPASFANRLRRWIWPAAPAAFLYAMLVKRCLFDGWPGLCYALQRTYFEALLGLELLERRWQSEAAGGSSLVEKVQHS